MKTEKHLLLILLTLLITLSTGKAQQDTLATVNMFAYHEASTSPLENVAIFISKLDTSTGYYSSFDTVFTNSEGKLTLDIPVGTYYMWPVFSGYTNMVYFQNLVLIDSTYNLEFPFVRPKIALSEDTIYFEFKDVTKQLNYDITISNEGTGKIVYSTVLYLKEQLPPDIQQYVDLMAESQSNKKSAKAYKDTDPSWKLLFKDDKDQEPGHHDLNEIFMKLEDGVFYLRATFYDTIRSFNNFYFIYAINSDRNEATGSGDNGIDYIIEVSTYNSTTNAALYQYTDDRWMNVENAFAAVLNPENNYIELAFSAFNFNNFDIMLGSAMVSAGNNSPYYDNIPQWNVNIPIVFSLQSDLSATINKFYGEVLKGESETLTLTIDPSFLANEMDTFYLALVCNDREKPIFIIPVIQKITPDVPKVSINAKMINSSAQCYPNPFGTFTQIEYYNEIPAQVKVSIYDLQGKEINIISDKMRSSGLHTDVWNGYDNSGKRVSPGIYIYSVKTGNRIIQGKIIVAK